MLLAIILALSAWLLSFVLPWWSLAIPALLLGLLLGKSGRSSFCYGFLGIASLWLIQTLIIHIQNDAILTTRMAELFSLPSAWLVLLATTIIGGLAGGLSCLTGYLLKQSFLSSD